MSGISPYRSPTERATKFVFIVLGITGLGLAIYYGTSFLRGKAKGTEDTTSRVTTTGADTGTQSGTQEVPSSQQQNSACNSTVEAVLSSDSAFQSWWAGKNTFLQSLSQKGTLGTNDQQSINATATELQGYATCLGSMKEKVGGASTTLATLRAQKKSLEATIAQRKKDVQIAQDRAAMAFNPDLTRSYYDGWFPLQRPLHSYSIPVLIAFALFFMSVAFFVALSFIGVDTRILIYRPSVSLGSSSSTQFTPAFWGMTVVAATLLGLTIYKFVA